MASFDDLLLTARTGMPQCPDVVLSSALTRAAREFFRLTCIWESSLDPVSLTAGQAEYNIVVADGIEAHHLVSAKRGNESCGGIAVVRYLDIVQKSACSGEPRAIALKPDSASFALWPTPNADAAQNNLLIYACLVSTENAAEIPDKLMSDWSRAFVAGAKAELMAIPKTAWYDRAESLRNESKFYEWVADAKRERLSGGGAPLRVRFRTF